jgi:1,4-dihydroxy-2-naphthoate octaprenyltransferase
VFVFFGLVATVGTAYVAIERIPGVTWIAATGVGLFACALLVINNLRDIPTDTAVAKRTLAVRLGDARTRHLYTALVVGAFLAAAVAAGTRNWSLMAIGALPVAQVPLARVRSGAAGPELIPILGATGRVQLLYGLLFSVGLALG